LWVADIGVEPRVVWRRHVDLCRDQFVCGGASMTGPWMMLRLLPVFFMALLGCALVGGFSAFLDPYKMGSGLLFLATLEFIVFLVERD
jgi:hypothetical protein